MIIEKRCSIVSSELKIAKGDPFPELEQLQDEFSKARAQDTKDTSSALNMESVNNFINSFYQEKDEDKLHLHFNIKQLYEISADEFIERIDKARACGNRYIQVAALGVFLSTGIKFLSQLGEMNIINNNNNNALQNSIENTARQREALLGKINHDISRNSYNYDVLWPYKYKLLQLINQKDTEHMDLIHFKEKIPGTSLEEKQGALTVMFLNEIIAKVEKNYMDANFLGNIFINQVTFIHFLEFLTLISDSLHLSSTVDNLWVANFEMHLAIDYFIWRGNGNINPVNTTKSSGFVYDEIVYSFLKHSIVYSLELIVKSKDSIPEETCVQILKSYFQIIFELEVNSNEVYIFAILSSLIIYVKNLHTIGSETFKHFINKNYRNHSGNCYFMLNLINRTIQKAGTVLSDRNYDHDYDNMCTCLILLKLLEWHLIKAYHKELSSIERSLSNINTSDFIMGNLFLFEKVYDTIRNSRGNFKAKLFWNFSEIATLVYADYPKMLKKTLYRHIKYNPNCESLVYNLILYYYTNKDNRKTKILIRKILGKISQGSNRGDERDTMRTTSPNPPLSFEIYTIILFMLVYILVTEEDFYQAKELAVLSLQRLTENETDRPGDEGTQSNMLARAHFILGFCYSKLGDISANSEDRQKNFQLALALFQEAIKYDKDNNSIFLFYYSRQLFELKLFKQCEEMINKIEVAISSNHNVIFYLNSLKVILNITQMKYDTAISICESLIRNNMEKANVIKLHYIYTLKYYLLIYKKVNFPTNQQEDENKLINSMIAVSRMILDVIDEQINENNILIDSVGNRGGLLGKKEVIMKEIVKFAEYQPYFSEEIGNDQLKSPKKVYLFEKKNLENIRIEVIKNFYMLADILVENGMDKKLRLHEHLKEICDKYLPHNLHDEAVNALMIKGIQVQFEGNTKEAENTYYKILEIYPSNMIALKKVSKLLLHTNADYSNAFIYINKAIKMDEEETELWNMLSFYYLKEGDHAKYYECAMKEIEISNYHMNSFFSGLIPKIIL